MSNFTAFLTDNFQKTMKKLQFLFLLFISVHITSAKSYNYTHKTALIIDNYDYGGIDLLPYNSSNITDLARFLSQVNFEVKVLTNLNTQDLDADIRDFYNSLPSESVSLLYYGGQISSSDNGRADLIAVDNNLKNPLKKQLSVQQIIELSRNNQGGDSHNFFLFDAFFTEQDYRKKAEQTTLKQGDILSFYDAKKENVLGESSKYLPVLIDELYQSQPLYITFENVDKRLQSISQVTTNWHNRDVFQEEHQTASIISISEVEMPSFPFPPPKSSASYTFDKELFSGINNLTQSSERIENALKKSGYYEKSYYQIPNGYALVTRIEKMENDGSPASEEERWNVSDTGSNSSFDLLSYFKSLFFAKDGSYRIIVFLVTSNNVQMSNNIMLMSEGQDFLSSGLNRLPPIFDQIPFTENHYCTALIYEWYKVEHEEAKFMEPSKFLGQYHLAKNKFVEYLEAEK